jgi:putative phosphoesterase
MRIAIISDIHGNCAALEAVLADLQRYPADEIVCLGDAIQGGAQPAETIALLRRTACQLVMGNADAWLLTGQDTSLAETATEKQLAAREWSLAQLSSGDLDFIRGFKPTVETELDDGKTLLCFHGSPHSFDDVILPETPEDEFQRLLGMSVAGGGRPLLTGGHTHLQQVRRTGDAFFFNPGSVGVAYDRRLPEESYRLDPWAEYALLSSEAGRLALEFRRVPYDIDQLVSIILASGRPNAQEFAAQYRPG